MKIKFLVLVWMVKTFFTMGGVTEFLNSLPPPRQLETKVTCGDTSMFFYVFYRE